MSKLKAILLLIFVISLTAPGQSLPDWTSQKWSLFPEISIGDWVESGVGDLDGDGHKELVAVSSRLQVIRVFRVSSSLEPQLLKQLSIPYDQNYASTIWGIGSVNIVDIDGNGLLDICMYQRANNRRGRVLIFLQNSAGDFEFNTYLTPESDAGYSMAVGDLDGDTLPEIVTVNHGYGAAARVFVLYNSTNASRFSTSSVHSAPTGWMTHVYVGDYNTDGKNDVIATTHPFGALGVALFPNHGSGLSAGYILAGPHVSQTASIADVNKDGLNDLLVTDSAPWSWTNTLELYLAQGDTFLSPVQVYSGAESRNPKLYDFNNDGLLDILVASMLPKTINIVFQYPGPSIAFSSPLSYSSQALSSTELGFGGLTNGLTMTDLTSDGSPEIVLPGSHAVVVGKLDGMPPSVSILELQPNPARVGAPISVTAIASDSERGNSPIAMIEVRLEGREWAPMTPSDGGWDGATENAQSFLPAQSNPGVYSVCVRASDSAGNTSQEACEFVAVYDPDGGFVTGGGAIDSPVGADVVSPSASGVARFGFVSKYHKGATVPSGNVQFRFEAGNLRFTSTSMEWLVVTGEPRAKFRGVGVVDGEGTCRFEVDAWDGSLDASGQDGFGFRLFQCSAQESRYSVPAQPLRQGSIVIHR
jgi:hypothetical protein